MNESRAHRLRLAECLEEVTHGVGPARHRYRVVGATREGLAPAKERVGKKPERYKLVEPGTIFYNPMRILLGSIAFLADDDPAITSPDYVVFRARSGIIHPRWFYHDRLSLVLRALRGPEGQEVTVTGAISRSRGMTSFENSLMPLSASACVMNPDRPTMTR